MGDRHQSTLHIEPDHPSLPGHFPGMPIVAGVVLLDLVLQKSEIWLKRALTVCSLQVKFHSPLLPCQTAQLSLDFGEDKLLFHVTRDGQTLAQGTFVVAGVSTA